MAELIFKQGSPSGREGLDGHVIDGDKTKSKKQVGLLLGKGSPLSSKQKNKLKRELHSGKVRIKDEEYPLFIGS